MQAPPHLLSPSARAKPRGGTMGRSTLHGPAQAEALEHTTRSPTTSQIMGGSHWPHQEAGSRWWAALHFAKAPGAVHATAQGQGKPPTGRVPRPQPQKAAVAGGEARKRPGWGFLVERAKGAALSTSTRESKSCGLLLPARARHATTARPQHKRPTHSPLPFLCVRFYCVYGCCRSKAPLY